MSRTGGSRILPHEHRADLLLALAATVATVAERLVAVPLPESPGQRAVVLVPALALAVVVGGALAWRRTAPLASYAVGTAALAVESLAVQPSAVSPYVNLAGIVSLAWFGSARRALWGPPVAVAGVAAWFARAETPALVPATVLLVWFICWGFAYQEARRREGDARRRAARLDEAVRAERTRIARELHDVVGHALSLMLVQVGAARTVLGQQPDTARDLLASTERAGGEAMAELDRVLGLLRADEGRDGATPADPEPRRGLADLDRLVARFHEAGLAVRLERSPDLGGSLPPTTDLTVYRVTQESLTNALRHGRARSARVVLGRQGTDLRLEVTDDGSGPPNGWEPGGGLVGITERVSLLGGSVEHGPGPEGGFRVAVRLPDVGRTP